MSHLANILRNRAALFEAKKVWISATCGMKLASLGTYFPARACKAYYLVKITATRSHVLHFYQMLAQIVRQHPKMLLLRLSQVLLVIYRSIKDLNFTYLF